MEVRVCSKKLICKYDDVWPVDVAFEGRCELYSSSNLAKKGSLARDDVPRSRGFGPPVSRGSIFMEARCQVDRGRFHRYNTSTWHSDIVIYQTLLRTGLQPAES
jgi:hypothetical protein